MYFSHANLFLRPKVCRYWKGMVITMDTQNTTENKDVLQDAAFKKLSRELRATRIFCTITSLLMICVLVGGCLVCTKVQGYVEEAWPLVEQLSTVDYVMLNDTMTDLDKSLNEVDWGKISAQLSELDIEAINEAIAGLDTEELTEALENLNEASDTLKNLSDSLKSITSRFGF